MRTRSWRRNKTELVHKRRLKNEVIQIRTWYVNTDVNGIRYQHIGLKELIDTYWYFKVKSCVTKKFNTKSKTKYSPNRSISYYRFGETREKSKIEVLKIMKLNGIK